MKSAGQVNVMVLVSSGLNMQACMREIRAASKDMATSAARLVSIPHETVSPALSHNLGFACIFSACQLYRPRPDLQARESGSRNFKKMHVQFFFATSSK